jgi:4-deoxy-L-threo-5-hexosulose-uronate ketol-isomerase
MNLDVRYATSPGQLAQLDNEALRTRFLVTELFADDQVKAMYSHHDRVILIGAEPHANALELRSFPEIRSDEFFQHREAGIVNVGGAGVVSVGSRSYEMEHGACLYVGRGSEVVTLASIDPEGEGGPARFYIFSAPAHTDYPTALVHAGEGDIRELGDPLTSNRRTVNRYIHEEGIRSCQIVMGVTTLHQGNVWNTLPAHTHDRRTECYLYFDLPDEARVVHLLGRPRETRHLVVANEEAVIAPGWSVHSGVGSASYSFVWAMAGENQSFDDMDSFPITEMR